MEQRSGLGSPGVPQVFLLDSLQVRLPRQRLQSKRLPPSHRRDHLLRRVRRGSVQLRRADPETLPRTHGLRQVVRTHAQSRPFPPVGWSVVTCLSLSLCQFGHPSRQDPDRDWTDCRSGQRRTGEGGRTGQCVHFVHNNVYLQ